MKGKFYITTPLYYVNDELHIGHAYCTIAADVLARFRRFCGDDVLFLTGTDEHGQKVEEAAASRGKKPLEWADGIVEKDRELWKKLDISYDDFIRTTQNDHIRTVQSIFEKLYKSGDIYKGRYEGWYCTPCETFLPESETEDKKCPQCRREVKVVSEESYFFRLSEYGPALLEYFRKNPSFMKPASRRNEMLNFVEGGLKDLSVSRTAVRWGIPVPFDGKHTVYVWFDALINYLTAAGYLEDEKRFARYWPADVHLVGKEIFKFHSIIWPAILLALGLALPRSVFGHGWWTVEGEKMSKSKNNVVDPAEISGKFGVDVFRYFLFREVPFGVDGDFSEKALIARYNAELANDLGNLLNRTLTMTEKYFESLIPAPGSDGGQLRELARNVKGEVLAYYDDFELSSVLASVLKLVAAGNKYIEENRPWKLEKEDRKKLNAVIYELLELLRITGLYLAPFMPSTSDRIWRQLGLDDSMKGRTIKDIEWGGLKPGTKISKGNPLFPKI